ncbi:hypothetical protein BASA61_009890 [Batrachochytrium salamandrivorans]|nr:hypothetical protein BASA60_010787 [Batrachochytrium salamandrivorans]KAH6569568.1 hypothetical protein BASA62_004734 [Batrachochytrium salamandrivorans]KAH6580078.1 hypothetical protein BASA61_009890 [Batrachochytrium salamandrivorans]KAH9268874.1 hypothetical protein BASA83_009162 [Batrachochytrium salamandrivorans]
MAPIQIKKHTANRKKKPVKPSRKAVRKAKDAYHSSSDEDQHASSDSDNDAMDTLDDIQLSDVDEYGNINDDMLGEDIDDHPKGSISKNDVKPAENDQPASLKGSAKLASTISKLLAPDTAPKPTAKPVKAAALAIDSQRPILSKKRTIEADIDEEKLDAKARKVLSADRKARNEKGRVIPDHTTMTYEKKLKKLATRGVVQLFNAIRAAQRSTDDLKADGIQKHDTEASTVSKETFIKTLKEEGARGKSSLDSVKDTETSSSKKRKADSSGVAWVKSDFAMKAPKHWDQEEEEEEGEDAEF